MTRFKELLSENKSNIALIIGNGINRYGGSENNNVNDWSTLLKKLAAEVMGPKEQDIPDGMPLPEYYDVLELNHEKNDAAISLQKGFCDLMQGWEAYNHHRTIVSWAKSANCPLLTTNFDKLLSEAGDCQKFSSKHSKPTRPRRFSKVYPWEKYYGTAEFTDPCSDFGIWHINGMECYSRSIRLGLSHYMGSAAQARKWLFRGDNRLFAGENTDEWNGANTWLQVIFHKPLMIFGLGLERDEVFLRSLIIERARYFKKFPNRKKSAWYAYPKDGEDKGKNRFLKAFGVLPVSVEDYDELYSKETWS